tara:strand:- start:4794 stop:5015 length:222 start_codon:yes stop_codon:yes gene_type:complete
MVPTHEELKEHGIEIDHIKWATWNDGGSSNTWIYKFNERFWKVLQPTDYLPDVEIFEVFQNEKIVITYDEQRK